MKQPVNSKTFCILPWIHVNSSVGGGYRPCCNSESYFKINDNDVSIIDAFHSKEMEEIRIAMKDEKEHPACSVCYDREKNNGLSFRHTYTQDKFKNFVNKRQDEKIEYLDIRFDNSCNLMCRMCDPSSSNLLADTINEYKKNNLQIPNHWKKFENFKQKNNEEIANLRKQYVIEVLPGIKELKVTGGEPFISKDFLEILDFAIENNYAKDIRLLITTNATKFVRDVLDRLKYFRALDMNISVDGMEETYEYIRFPFSWKKWEDRFWGFLKFADEHKMYKNPEFRIRTSTIVTAYNWLILPDLYNYLKNVARHPAVKWLNNINFIPRIDFNLNLRPYDSELSAKYLPKEILVEGFFKWLQTDYRQKQEIKTYIDNADKIDPLIKIEKNKQLKYITTTLDTQRSQSYKVLDPMFKKWMETVSG